jgi:hypothetical protein
MRMTHQIRDGANDTILVRRAIGIESNLALVWWVILCVDKVPWLRVGHPALNVEAVGPDGPIRDVKFIIGFDKLVEQFFAICGKVQLCQVPHSAMAYLTPCQHVAEKRQEQCKCLHF